MSLIRDLCGPLSSSTRPQTQAESVNLHNRHIFNITPAWRDSAEGKSRWWVGVRGVTVTHLQPVRVSASNLALLGNPTYHWSQMAPDGRVAQEEPLRVQRYRSQAARVL